jgi:hypothetical protein
MGTWNTSLKGNDSFLDIYSAFNARYNSGENPVEISRSIREEFSDMFGDPDDKNNALFALALAQWETKSEQADVFKEVRQIIEAGNDLEVWRNLGADEKTINQRRIALAKFWEQISLERKSPKRRSQRKFEFHTIDLVRIIAPDHKKTFSIIEEYGDGKYIHTGGIMMWSDGGGSVLYFNGQGKSISAKWLDSQTLEVVHDDDIVFTKKDDSAFFLGDSIRVVYKAE